MKSDLLPAVGLPAPDFILRDTEDRRAQLSDYWKGRSVIFVFLRQLGCTFCRAHVVELRREYNAFRAQNTEIVCIAMGNPKVGKAFKLLFDLPFSLLMTGETAEVYRVYKLQKATWGLLFGPPTWAKGIAAIRQLGAKYHGGLQGDGFQLQGTFIVDSLGIIQLAYRGKDAADNPPNQQLLETLRSIHSGEPVDASKFATA